ncbi:helix-turn-helix domain-containing protein [Phormidesmis sp. 146-33]
MIREAEFYEELGRRINATRKQRGLTQEELADRVGLTRTSITNIEKGRQKVLSHLLVELSDALNVSLHDLLPNPDAEARALQAMPPIARDWIQKTVGSRSSQ